MTNLASSILECFSQVFKEPWFTILSRRQKLQKSQDRVDKHCDFILMFKVRARLIWTRLIQSSLLNLFLLQYNTTADYQNNESKIQLIHLGVDIRILTDGFHKEKQLYTIKKLSLYSYRLKFHKVLHLLSKSQILTARKWSLGQGNIFSPICHSVHRRGSTWVGTSPADTLPWQVHLPRQVQPPPGQVHHSS